MKTIIITIIFLATTLIASEDLGIRYLKLGNTYREASEYNKAEEFLNKGRNLVSNGNKWENKYWSAVANEYFAYLYNDLSKKQTESKNEAYFKQLSMEYFNKAKRQYQTLINIQDGSQDAIEEVIKNLNGLEKKFNAQYEKNAKKLNSKVLNYEKLKLREIPTGINENVENLSLADNKYKEFPPGLSKYKNLKYLNLSNNKIKSISPDIEQLNNLQWLDLSNNKIKTIPENLCNLTNLEYLSLMDNKLKAIPACICQMTSLKILNLKNNDLDYPQIANIIKCLPNTNVLIDEYEKVKGKTGETLIGEPEK